MADNNKENDGEVTFTGAETKFLLCALKHLEGGLNFNADAVAAELGYKDGTIARNRWSTINRTKIQGAAGSASAGVKKPRSAKKKAPKATIKSNAVADIEEAVAESTPYKPSKKRSGNAQAEDEDADDGRVKIKAEEDEDVA